MPYSKKLIDKRLTGKFGFDRNEKGDHIRYALVIAGMTVTTKLSHGSSKDIPAWLESEISKQLKVKKGYFRQMIDCSISQDEYYEELKMIHKRDFPDG